MGYLLTFDVGTTSMKCCVFDSSLSVKAKSAVEYSLQTSDSHIVETNPAIYWEGLCSCIHMIKDQVIDLTEVEACAITTQGETMVLLGEDGNPFMPAIVWLDDRGSIQAERLARSHAFADYYRRTGMPEITGATPLAKLAMLFEDAQTQENIWKVMLLEDYLVFKLTGSVVTEHSLVSSTGYYDILKHDYCQDYLEYIGVKKDLLPEILPCGTVAGYVAEAASTATNLPRGTAVVVTAMDQICSAIGAGNVRPGVVTETTGTCLTLAATVQQPTALNNSSIQYYTHYDGNYLAIAYNTTAAIILKWLKDTFISQTEDCKASALNPYDYMSELAKNVPAGAEGLMLLPHFAGKLMPDYAPNVRGCFYGLALNTKQEHFVRAAMEGIAFMLRENLEALQQAGIYPKQVRSLGGGAKDPVLSQIKASVNAIEFVTTSEQESTSLGSAMLAAKALGWCEDLYALSQQVVKFHGIIQPNAEETKVYNSIYPQYLELDKLLSNYSRHG